MLTWGDPTIRAGCRNARHLARLCDLLDAPLGQPGAEMDEAVEAATVGMTYQELEQYDPSSSFYDPDIGPYFWED